MQQLTQQLKSGKMEIVEVPIPQLQPGQVMIQNFYSVISAGTEGKTVSDARKGYIAKARSRKKEVKQVIELIRTQGVKKAYGMVMNKLEALSPLGYSSSGKVIAVGENVKDIAVGDHVACGGASASHAEIVAVPKNLCVKLNKAVDFKESSFITLASIALQGIRQSAVQTGGTCVVIGLGLIGIITLKLLDAMGVKAIGIDIDQERVDRAIDIYKIRAAVRNKPGLTDELMYFTDGIGADAIIISAAATTTDPVNLAGELARNKAKVVVVGSVPTGFERKNYYRKELELLMSCSYGPGRYDPLYEEKGIDYPPAFARWTEQRNMQTIADLLANRKIDFSDLASHTFSIEKSPDAYKLILEKKEPYMGILIQYAEPEKFEKTIVFKGKVPDPAKPNIGIIGVGSFAQNVMLPIIQNEGNMTGVAASRGIGAFDTARKYNFQFGTTSPEELIGNKDINTVFIFTRHDTHAQQAILCLRAGMHTFVEKPLCLTMDELDEIKKVYSTLTKEQPLFLVGFNRRFAPSVWDALRYINKELPRAINIRINAGSFPPGHWIHDPKIGGGRIIGECCHFVDLACHLAGSKVNSVFAQAMGDSQNLDDTLNISLRFANGSIANISYFSNGNKLVPKEEIEIFTGQTVIRLNDYLSLSVTTPEDRKKIKYAQQDKGHSNEVKSFLQSISKGMESPVPFEEIIDSMHATLLVNQSLQERRVIAL